MKSQNYNISDPLANKKVGSSSRLAEHKWVVILSVLTVCFAAATIVLALKLGITMEEETQYDGQNASTTSSTSPPAPLEAWEEHSRIPEDIIPDEYEISLHPDFSDDTFSGHVSIKVAFSKSRSWIPIHIKDLRILSAEIINSQSKSIALREAKQVPEHEFYVMFPENIIPSGKYSINITFTGSLANKMVGFYRSFYRDSRGMRTIATSKFEPTDARAAFPCFDEPAIKAKFSISLVRPRDGYMALSNMDLQEESDYPGDSSLTIAKFKTTLPMSTYLVCFIVSDFKSSGIVYVDNGGQQLPIQVFSTMDQVLYTEHARNIAEKVTRWYINYFNMSLPLPKLDLIGIPDFLAGAMENWGLITFRETNLLFDPVKNSPANEERVAHVVSHEISHMWFGDLVTLAWWDDLWLNEGFACFMELKALTNGCDNCSSWNLLERAIYEVVQPVMHLDAGFNSHPIVQTVDHPNQIKQLFDGISYDKGASVLRMLENFLGEDKFQKGLQNYLKKHQLNNAATSDLWSSLDEVAPEEVSVTNVMATWTQQMGFPVVHVKRNGAEYQLRQTRFLRDCNATFDENESPFKYTWDIPIRYRYSHMIESEPTKLIWLKRDTPTVAIPVEGAAAYVKLNTKQFGFYRVNYEPDTWEDLINNFESLDAADQSHLLDDAFNLARSGYISYNIPLDMSISLSADSEFLPWSTALAELDVIRGLLSETPTFFQFRAYEMELLAPLYGTGPNQFSWNVSKSDFHLKRLQRSQFLYEAASISLPSCIADVTAIFKEWLNEPTTYIPSDLRPLVYSFGMEAIGNEEEWDKLWNLYKIESNVHEKINFQRALASVRHPWLLRRFLDIALNEEDIRQQDHVALLATLSERPVGASVVWDYYRSNWPALVQRFGLSDKRFGAVISAITSTFSTQLRLDELNAFYKLYPEAGAGSEARKRAAESIQNRISWIKRSEPDIAKWLSKMD